MEEQNKSMSIDVNLVVEEYENTIKALTIENLRQKTLIKQLQVNHQKELTEIQEVLSGDRHAAPPAPMAIEEEILEAN